MKKFLITVLLAIIIGGIFGFIAFKKVSSPDNTLPTLFEEKVYAIQAGVFTSYDHATTLANEYSGIIVPDSDKYRVYLAISSGSNSLSLLKNYYDQLGISYYVKEITSNDSFTSSLNQYESLLSATTEDNYGPIINDILKEYEKTLT
jgi:hypothetical protein